MKNVAEYRERIEVRVLSIHSRDSLARDTIALPLIRKILQLRLWIERAELRRRLDFSIQSGANTEDRFDDAVDPRAVG